MIGEFASFGAGEGFESFVYVEGLDHRKWEELFATVKTAFVAGDFGDC